MNIRFSDDYEKLPLDWENSFADIIGVCHIFGNSLKNECNNFLLYDTKFRGKKGYYKIDFDKCFWILTFMHKDSCKIFTTLKKCTGDNCPYMVGDTYKLVRG